MVTNSPELTQAGAAYQAAVIDMLTSMLEAKTAVASIDPMIILLRVKMPGEHIICLTIVHLVVVSLLMEKPPLSRPSSLIAMHKRKHVTTNTFLFLT